MPLNRPEILAPVGNWEMCLAAVHNGADAIYIGMPNFNARGRAHTFEIDELRQIIEFCHTYGVKVFVAFNVLIFEREIPEAISLLQEVIPLSPDAFIVQDLGLARLIQYMCPEHAVHGSTQMSVTSYEGIHAVEDLNISRFVLGREVSLEEMNRIRERTEKELEVFVHGALCVSYSGQCLTSESLGGRSANRGQCAQSCRLAYDLIVDGQTVEMGERRYLVSPKDLCALEDVERLKEIGIDSFKIEGRLKSPEYVASTVKSYRTRIDEQDRISPSSDELKILYSRDFFNGWMNGVNHQRLVDGRYSGHRGLEVGEVSVVEGRSLQITSCHELKAGDGVVFCDFKKELEVGASIYSVEDLKSQSNAKRKLRLTFANDLELGRLYRGMKVFLNSSPSLAAKWRRSFTDKAFLRKIPLSVTVSGQAGEKLQAQFEGPNGISSTVLSSSPLQPAQNSPLSDESLRSELGALAGTPFTLTNLTVTLNSPLFLHQRELKIIRREACSKLLAAMKVGPEKKLQSVAAVGEWISNSSRKHRASEPGIHNDAQLSVLIRSQEQLDALDGLELGVIYLDYEFGRDYAPSVERIRSMGLAVGIATTRILKPGETGHLNSIRRLKPDCILVRNLGAWFFLKDSGTPMIGDFSLNVSNCLTADYLFEKGFQRLCASYDLNREQLFDLLDASMPERFEITVHQYMPSFHMEHCVFAAFLSNGTSYRDCGRPCERHQVALKDRKGAVHPLKADAECRNTMFNGQAQSAARLVPDLLKKGIVNFRLEALEENPKQLREKTVAYQRLISGDHAAEATLGALGIVEKYGVTEGQLLNLRSYKDRKKPHVPIPTVPLSRETSSAN